MVISNMPLIVLTCRIGGAAGSHHTARKSHGGRRHRRAAKTRICGESENGI